MASTVTSAADSELSSFKVLQESIGKLRQNQQLLMQQLSENEMVKQELDLIKDNDPNEKVFKMVGPVLMSHSLEEAKSTVDKRIEFIAGDLSRVENAIATKEQESSVLAGRINEIQGRMQRDAAEGARRIAQEASV